MLTAEHIYLRLMEEGDIPYKVKWVNDSEVRRTLNIDYPISEVGTKHWLNKVTTDGSRKDFIVCLNKYNTPIGYGGFLNIDIKNSKAELYMVIGDKTYWDKGYDKEIRKLLLDYAFKGLRLNRIYSYVLSENEKIMNLNKSSGFVIEGLLNKDVFTDGEYRDRYIMCILRENYLVSI